MYICLLHLCLYTCVSVYSGQKWVLDLLELKFQAAIKYVMWVLGIKFWFTARAVCAPSH